MSYTRIEEMPCVVSAIRRAEMEIRELVGKDVSLRIDQISYDETERKTILQEIVCNYFQVSWSQIAAKSRSNKENVVDARHTYMYLAHTICKCTLVEVAQDCGRDHTTAVHAVQKIKDYYKVKDHFTVHVDAIKKLLQPEIFKNEKV